MRPNTEDMIRAAVVLQAAALQFDSDTTATQAQARQALLDMAAALEKARLTLVSMRNGSEDRRADNQPRPRRVKPMDRASAFATGDRATIEASTGYREEDFS